jgi:biopolymer transport protein ExbD
MRSVALTVLLAFAVAQTLPAQSPIPVIVPAATPAAITSQQSANSASLQETLKILQEMKAANEETLRKQAATLEQLDVLEKEAEQLKIYSKRG